MRGPLPARYALLEGAFRNGDYQGAYGAVGNWAACHPGCVVDVLVDMRPAGADHLLVVLDMATPALAVCRLMSELEEPEVKVLGA